MIHQDIHVTQALWLAFRSTLVRNANGLAETKLKLRIGRESAPASLVPTSHAYSNLLVVLNHLFPPLVSLILTLCFKLILLGMCLLMLELLLQKIYAS
jgi:hypothetical protein